LDRDHRTDEADLPHRTPPAFDPAERRRIESVGQRDQPLRIAREVEHALAMKRRRRDQHVGEVQDVREVPIELRERLRREASARIELGAMRLAVVEEVRPDAAEAMKADVPVDVLADLELSLDALSA